MIDYPIVFNFSGIYTLVHMDSLDVYVNGLGQVLAHLLSIYLSVTKWEFLAMPIIVCSRPPRQRSMRWK